jgi:hypothetical protein
MVATVALAMGNRETLVVVGALQQEMYLALVFLVLVVNTNQLLQLFFRVMDLFLHQLILLARVVVGQI